MDTPLCFGVYNKRIKTDGYSITLTMPGHNSICIIEPQKNKEVVRKMTVTEQFRLMGLGGLQECDEVNINLVKQSYTKLSRRAVNS